MYGNQSNTGVSYAVGEGLGGISQEAKGPETARQNLASGLHEDMHRLESLVKRMRNLNARIGLTQPSVTEPNKDSNPQKMCLISTCQEINRLLSHAFEQMDKLDNIA